MRKLTVRAPKTIGRGISVGGANQLLFGDDGAILSGIGGIFYYQNMSGDWASWSYIWALIPAFVGVGVIIGGLIDKNYKDGFSGGLTLIVISAILFLVFGSAFGLDSEFTQYWPVLLIALGLISLVRVAFSKSKR